MTSTESGTSSSVSSASFSASAALPGHRNMPIRVEPSARSIAAHVVERVEREGAFAAAVLDTAVERFPELDLRERALATELAYGALRTAPYLERRLADYA